MQNGSFLLKFHAQRVIDLPGFFLFEVDVEEESEVIVREVPQAGGGAGHSVLVPSGVLDEDTQVLV